MADPKDVMSLDSTYKRTQTQFFIHELQEALGEHSFGVTSSEVISSSDLEASAAITLLEGDTINVALNTRGYKVTNGLSAQQDMIFETMDDLLASISPRFLERRQEVIFKKLSALVE